MPIAHLDDRSLIRVRGPDARSFLQNIVTTDLEILEPGQALPGALLSPQGKILFDFLVSRDGEDGFVLDCPAGSTSDFARRLTLYKLRAKVEIVVADQSPVAVRWGDDSVPSSIESGWLTDRRFRAARVERHQGPALPGANADAAAWRAFRIGQGVPESGDDFALGEPFPHDALLDQIDGIGMKKGCYVGQEVVSRMQHRGTARRRFLLASAREDLPPPGTSLTAGGRAIGTLGSVEGAKALALVRIDRAKEAMDAGLPIEAGTVEVALAIPSWAAFRFPEDVADEA